jgi:hypothetical protein
LAGHDQDAAAGRWILNGRIEAGVIEKTRECCL